MAYINIQAENNKESSGVEILMLFGGLYRTVISIPFGKMVCFFMSYRSLKNFILEVELQFYISCGILRYGDVISSTEEVIMNKILKEVHPYTIYFSESENRWCTYIADDTKLSGRKRIVRKREGDLEKVLLMHYHAQLNATKAYTFEGLYNEFMQYKDATTSPNTVKEYIKAYNRFYKDDPIVNEDLSKIPSPTLRMWLESNIRKHKLNYKAYEKMAVVFNQLYKYALQMEYVDRNPFDRIDVRSLGLFNAPKKSKQQCVFSKSETEDICRVAFEDFANKPYCVPLAVLLSFQIGTRISEIVALKKEDIDLESMKIRICRYERSTQNTSSDYKSLAECKKEILEYNTKGAYGERLIDITDDALYVLQLLSDFYKSENMQSEWLFINNNGRIHNRAMDLRIRKYCRMIGIKEKSMHKVRSTYISKLRASGMNFERIQELVGHKSMLTTINHYLYDTEDDIVNRKILNDSLNILTKNPGVQKCSSDIELF